MAGPESQSSSAGAAIKGFNTPMLAPEKGAVWSMNYEEKWMKLYIDLSLLLSGSCSYRGCRALFTCLCFLSWDDTYYLIPRNVRMKYRA